MRESLYPNIALRYGVSSANVYMPLLPRDLADYMASLTPEGLNRLNVRYVLIPQLLPVDAERELYDVTDPFAALPLNEWISLPSQSVHDLAVQSYLSHSVDLPDGQVVAEIWLRDAQGQEIMFPLRAGIDTAEWAYERDDVLAQIRHSQPEIATTFPARSGFPPRDHVGHTYMAHYQPDQPLVATAIRLVPVLPEAFVRIESVTLHGDAGQSTDLADVLGLGHHTIVYRSEDVLVYRNEDALPRAYTLPAGQVAVAGHDVTLPARLRSAEVGAVQIDSYEAEDVTLAVDVDAPSYLILADLDYPGWQVQVDGETRPILRADGVMRAVALDAGHHVVRFSYHPLASLWLRLGRSVGN